MTTTLNAEATAAANCGVCAGERRGQITQRGIGGWPALQGSTCRFSPARGPAAT
jgi:hypothetical protein